MNFASLTGGTHFDPEKYQKNLILGSSRSALDVYSLLPGQSQRLHAHEGTDKYYLVWQGRATIQIGEEVRELGPGEAALAPADVPHSITNTGDEPVVAAVFRTLKAE